MDQKQLEGENNKENDSNIKNVLKEHELNEDIPTASASVENIGETDETKKTAKKKILKNSTLGERFKEQMKLSKKKTSSDEDESNDESTESFGNDCNSSSKRSNSKRSKADNEQAEKESKRIKVSHGDNGMESSQMVVRNVVADSNSKAMTLVDTEDHVSAGNNVDQIITDKDSFPKKTLRSRTPKRKRHRKEKEKESSNEAVLKMYSNMNANIDWIKEHLSGLESFVVEKLTANSENWNHVKHVKQTLPSTANSTIEDINRPPEVGYVRLDTNMIHLGQNVWLLKQTYDDAVFNASSNSMFVKNIAMAVFGAKYLKEHSVKGKSSNKTKSVARPAIDTAKALAIRDIFEYYLKNTKLLTGEKLLSERDSYEDHIRAKISDLLRVPKKCNKKVAPLEQKKITEPGSSSSSSSSSEDEEDLNKEESKLKERVSK